MSSGGPGAASDSPGSGTGFSAHTVRLAWILAAAYLAVVIYASLQPFRVWRMPPEEVLRFLTAPWPRYITLEDIVVNAAAYVPLGFLLSIGLGARRGAALGALEAACAAAVASLAMEAAQMFQPARIASNVDLLTNGVGGLLGAMAAPLFAPSRLVGGRLHEWRHRRFLDGMAADAGFVVVCLWVLAQLNPLAQLFGTGALRGALDLPAYAAHAPRFVLAAEAAVVFLNVASLGMIVAALTRPAARPMFMIAGVVAAGCALKTAAAALARASHPLVWLTPGAVAGIVGGFLALHWLRRLPRGALLSGAALGILGAAIILNLAPDNPYQNIPARLVGGGPSHYLSFSGIMRALSDLWPFLALAYLGFALSGRGSRGG
ncbi:MAG: VanZ family protein [Burkholderiales bacterium]|nr:VanZ family protein [Burkholderiales bacterium]